GGTRESTYPSPTRGCKRRTRSFNTLRFFALLGSRRASRRQRGASITGQRCRPARLKCAHCRGKRSGEVFAVRADLSSAMRTSAHTRDRQVVPRVVVDG